MTDFEKLAALEGLITPDVGVELHRLAKEVPADQAIVEIGAWKGKSTCYLSAGAGDGLGAHVYSVDTWSRKHNEWSRQIPSAYFTEWEEQVTAAGYRHRVEPQVGLSVEVAQNWAGPKIGLLYVDGDHAGAAVMADFNAWRPYLAPDALVVFDDFGVTHNPEVAPAVQALVDTGKITAPDVLGGGRIAVAGVI